MLEPFDAATPVIEAVRPYAIDWRFPTNELLGRMVRSPCVPAYEKVLLPELWR